MEEDRPLFLLHEFEVADEVGERVPLDRPEVADAEGLEELLERAESEVTPAAPAFPAFSTETWNVSALGGPFALLSRGGARPTPAQLAAISEILTNTVTK